MMTKRFITRRSLLTGAGATLVLVAGGGVWRAVDQGVFSAGEGPAYEPWKTWRTDEPKGMLKLVRAAILASNAHNAQPWLFRVTDSTIDVYADHRRNIGTVDPFLREMYISVGCALENLSLAAEANGYAPTLTLMPNDADPKHAAHLTFMPAPAKSSPLYDAIPNRHTNRDAYNFAKSVSSGTLIACGALNTDPDIKVFWYVTPDERQRFGDLTIAATESFIADAGQSGDSHRWFRHDWSDLQQQRDGLAFDALGLSPLITVLAKMLPEPSSKSNDEGWLKLTREQQIPTAQAFGLIAVRDRLNNRQRLRVGRFWQRMHLWATTQGLAMHPLNQMTERLERELQLKIEPRFGREVEALVSDSSWQALFPFRMGYPKVAAKLSPRRAVQDVMM
jgi:hypothetical protein